MMVLFGPEANSPCARFKALIEIDRSMAEESFEKNSEFYHPICRAMVKNLLDK